MDKTTMQAVLMSLNINSDTWIFDRDLNYIILENDGNHYHDYHKEFLYFDTTNDLLLIKAYEAKLISSRFVNITKIETGKYWAHPNKYGEVGQQYGSFPKFRSAMIGDRIKVFSGSILDADIGITNVCPHPNGGLILETDADVDVSNRIVIYSHPITDSSLPAPTDGTILVEDNNDPTAILIYVPETRYTVDQYIGFDSINGFSLKRG